MKRTRLYQLLVCLLCLFPARTLAQSLSQCEYWFDDDFKDRRTIGISGSEDDIDIDIDASTLGNGLHWLRFRLLQSDGMYSPVSSQSFFKIYAPNGGKLEYWFDDDRKNKSIIDGHVAVSGDAFVFNSNVDLNEITPGSHRLYYRLVDDQGNPNGPVSMTNVLLHSKINSVNPNSLRVTKYSISVDNETASKNDVITPMAVITLPYTVDTRNLNAGKHTLTTTFWNSLDQSTASIDTFNVVTQETPQIILKGAENNGVVKLSFNSIPNDVRYVVGRKNPDGKTVKIYENKNSNYPNSITVTDNPGQGEYIYLVSGVYTESDGSNKVIASNQIPISIIDNIQPETAVGSIIGRIVTNENQFFNSSNQIDAVFSDGEKVRVNPNGTFYRDGIPVGSDISITIPENDYYSYENISVKVDENTRNEVYTIQATPRSDNKETQPNNTNYDLQIISKITGIPNEFTFDLKNITSLTWSGTIDLIAVKKKDNKKMGSLTEGSVSFATVDTYTKVGSIDVQNLNSGKTKNVTIQVSDFPIISDNEYYFFYLVSKANKSQTGYKMLAVNTDLAENPKELLMEKTSSGHDYSEFVEKELNECIAEILKTMNDCEKYGGPLQKAFGEASSALKRYERDHDAENLFGNLPDILKFYSEDLKNAYKDVKQYTDILKDVKNFYSYYSNAKEFKEADDFKRFILLAKAIFKYSDLPFANVYSMYLDVAETAVNKIYDYMGVLIDAEQATNFADNAITYKIKVKKKNWHSRVWSSYFEGYEIASNIESVKISLCNAPQPVKSSSEGVWQYASFEAVSSNDCVTLNRISYHTPMQYGSEVGFNGKTQRFWAEITWRNGRITNVPLLYDEIVEIKGTRRNPVITITFQSESSSSSHMADIIHLETAKD